jgi:hypothetical protein
MADNDEDNGYLNRNEPERRNYQLKLPVDFENEREELYSNYSKMIMSHKEGDDYLRNAYLKQYLERVNYIVDRILPKLRHKDKISARSIQVYAQEFLITFNNDFEAGVIELNNNHQTLNQMLYDYDLSKIVLTDFTAF